MMDNVFNNFNRQTVEEKEMIIILNKDTMNKKQWEKKAKNYNNIFVFQLPERTSLGDCLNFGTTKAKYDIVGKFDDDDYYSPYYLAEALHYFNTTNADIIGKGVSFIYFQKEKLLALRVLGKENDGGQKMLKGGTIMFRKKIYPKVKFPSIVGSGTDSRFVKLCIKAKLRFHTTSRFNYVYIRFANSKKHTFKKSNKLLIKKSKRVCHTDNFNDIVTKELQKIRKESNN
ncbi:MULTISPECIES: glycosyltransferase [unclassified Sutcliffiella]|uniref:glycosyltransferase n=1 Tax=unclassified Sutcliffiella TaxID=2837532 RepID=UPI0030D31947